MPDWDRFERFLDHHESYVENQTEVSVVLAVPLFRIETTMYLEGPELWPEHRAVPPFRILQSRRVSAPKSASCRYSTSGYRDHCTPRPKLQVE